MMHPAFRLLVLLTLTALAAPAAPALAQTDAEGYRPLTQWRAYKGTGVPPQWSIDRNSIEHTPGGGDLVSVEQFQDFDLSFEWQVAPGGNSGVMYRVSEDYPAPYQSGPEYQILDNATAEGHDDPLQTAAGCYGLYAPTAAAAPAGEWNTARIVVEGNHVEHWLNGAKVVDYQIGSPDWTAKIAGSKFAAWPEYAASPTGHIDLQDHGSAVAYRNIRIKVLP
jgi:hypothetical protein